MKWIKILSNLFSKKTPRAVQVTEKETKSPFRSLSPIDSADTDGQYSSALLWALKNRKAEDIKNIALTGPYGSGKSSILKTFEKNNEDDDLVFLNISLATFKEEKSKTKVPSEDPNDNGNNPNTDIAQLRLIELSILQQIFYHEKDEDIPDSRFKKTRSFPEEDIKKLTISLFIFGISIVYQLYPKLFKQGIVHWNYPDWMVPILKYFDLCLFYLTLIIILYGSYKLILLSIRPVRSLQLKKFNFQEAEFGVDESINKSILNDHLDEILYFFEVTKYTVVVIEDLDRFEQTEIFTKLRELNLLINYSKKISREVVFIYAVRDDMFQDKDRTKFFDFIIPVIPVINSSNSNEKLLQIINENSYPIESDLVEDISLFVDDMRLLYNIANEYHIYSQKLSKKLDQNKLLALIVYKNIYPNDFVELSNSTGQLYKIFESKAKHVKKEEEIYNKKILELKDEIKAIESIKINDIHELRKLYILEYVARLNYISSFQINSKQFHITDATEDEMFNALIANEGSYVHYQTSMYGIRTDAIPEQFSDIESSVDANFSYAERANQIGEWENDKTEILKKKIAETEQQKTKLRHYSIKELMATTDCSISLEDIKQNQLVNILLRSGYIDEQYLDYVSIFYEGSITKQDREFLLNVKAHIKTDYDYKLEKIDKLIPKIPAAEFEQSFLFNYSLLDYLFNEGTNKTKRNSILKTLGNESTDSISFINAYIDHTTHESTFIAELTKNWPGIWRFISTQSAFTQERKELYFKLIVTYSDIKDIQSIAAKSKLSNFIAEYEDFLTVIPDQEKLKKIISTLKIKFIRQNFEEAPADLIDFVYSGDYYEITKNMIANVIKAKGNYNEVDFEHKNYTAINCSGCAALVKYVDDNLVTYAENVLAALPDNSLEKEEYLKKLINNEFLDDEVRLSIIDKNKTKLTFLEDIERMIMQDAFLTQNKVVANWDNMVNYYVSKEKLFEQQLIDFINNMENASALSAVKINTTDPLHGEALVKEFIVKMLLENNIADDVYAIIIKAIPYRYNSGLDVSTLKRRKVEVLVNGYVLNLTKHNYELLRDNFSDIHVLLAENFNELFIENIENYEIDANDALKFLKSGRFTIADKNIILGKLDNDTLLSDGNLFTLLGTMALEHPTFNVPKDVILHILQNTLMISEKVALFNTMGLGFTNDEILTVIGAWPKPFSDIIIKGLRPLLPHNDENIKLAALLAHKGLIKGITPEDKGLRISTFRK